ncbi:MAG: peptide chain release factor N(5)-glutamine methyltransferase [Cyanobacteria bacterium J06648_11]
MTQLVSSGDRPFSSELLLQLLHWRAEAIASAHLYDIESLEVDLLLEHFAGWSAGDRLLGRSPARVNWQQLNDAWRQRWRQRAPLQYIVGVATWRDLELHVSPAVLIPRPETELLIELARPDVLASPPESTWVDLGTGSGAIAIALARLRSDLSVVAVDVSAEALQIAARNVGRYALDSRVRLWQGSWFAPLQTLKGQLWGMVSNPPYIPSLDVAELQPEVARYEPHMALDGGVTGLDAIASLMQVAPEYVVSGGFWAVELMQGQARAVATALQADNRYRDIAIHADLNGIDRFVSAKIV